jgi:hypothetical protein
MNWERETINWDRYFYAFSDGDSGNAEIFYGDRTLSLCGMPWPIAYKRRGCWSPRMIARVMRDGVAKGDFPICPACIEAFQRNNLRVMAAEV